MKIRREVLLPALHRASKVVKKRTTLPALTGVLLSTSEFDTLSLTSTDMDVQLSERVAAAGADKWGIVVPAHQLFAVVERLPADSELVITKHEGQLAIESGSTRVRIDRVCAPSDFPRMKPGKIKRDFTIPSDVLSAAIRRVRYAISTEETWYYLNGVYLQAKSEVLHVVATDGHRLAKVALPLPAGAEEVSSIVPRKTIGLLRRILKDNEFGNTKVIFSNDNPFVIFESGAIVITSKTIDAKYPDYERVIPKMDYDPLLAPKPLLILREPLLAALRLTSAIGSYPAVKLSLSPAAAVVSRPSKSEGLIEVKTELAAEYEDEPFDIGFNAQYLIDVCESMGGSHVKFQMLSATEPVIVTDPEDPELLTVLMPMRL